MKSEPATVASTPDNPPELTSRLPAVLVERVKSGGHRPLLDDDPRGTLQKMYNDRAALYREAAAC